MHDSEAAYNEDFPNMHYETDRPKWPEFKGKKLVLRMPITHHRKLSNMTQEMYEKTPFLRPNQEASLK